MFNILLFWTLSSNRLIEINVIGCSSSASVKMNIKFGAEQPSCGQEIANIMAGMYTLGTIWHWNWDSKELLAQKGTHYRLIYLPLSITIMACCSLGSYKGISWITWSHTSRGNNEQHKLMNKNRPREREVVIKLSNLRGKAGEGVVRGRNQPKNLCAYIWA